MDQSKKPEQPPNVLKIPEGIAPTGPVMDMTEAYVRAVIAIPELLMNLCTVMDEINDSLSVLGLYAERKGTEEGYIKPEDLANDKGEGSGKN